MSDTGFSSAMRSAIEKLLENNGAGSTGVIAFTVPTEETEDEYAATVMQWGNPALQLKMCESLERNALRCIVKQTVGNKTLADLLEAMEDGKCSCGEDHLAKDETKAEHEEAKA